MTRCGRFKAHAGSKRHTRAADWRSVVVPLTPEMGIAFVTLLALELVLGIDNIVFISIIAGRLPEAQRDKAIRYGLGGALVTRILFLLGLSWIIGLTAPLFTVFAQAISGRDLILLAGGLFLLYKSTKEIHHKLEGEHTPTGGARFASFGAVIAQIMVLDSVFAIDSVVTAVGMVDNIWVMIAAVVIAITIVMFYATKISNFVHAHPSVKMLALAFLLLIGTTLIAEAFDAHVPKGYIYFSIAFAAFVEVLNLRLRAARKRDVEPVHLHEPYMTTEGQAVIDASRPDDAPRG